MSKLCCFNGFPDMVGCVDRKVLWGTGRGDWTLGDLPEGLPELGNPNLRFLDYDNDWNIDALYEDGARNNSRVMRNRGDGMFEAPRYLDVAAGESMQWSFSQGMRLADMNGDGMADAVLVATDSMTTSVFYRVNLGWGRFSPK